MGPEGIGDLRLGSLLPGQARGLNRQEAGLRGQGSASPPKLGGPLEPAGSLLTSSWGPWSSSYSRASERVARGHHITTLDFAQNRLLMLKHWEFSDENGGIRSLASGLTLEPGDNQLLVTREASAPGDTVFPVPMAIHPPAYRPRQPLGPRKHMRN